MSSIVNTSKGGGYAPFVVVDDINSPESVTAAEMVRPKYPAPLMTHLPMFVAAQLIQVSRLGLEIRKQLLTDRADSYELLGITLSLKLQCREIMSFLNPRAIEPVYKLIDALEAKQAKKEIAAGNLYEHFIFNDHMERAYAELKSVLIDGKHSQLSKTEGMQLCDKLVEEFETSPLLQSLRKKFGH
jgi:hypothetical protein